MLNFVSFYDYCLFEDVYQKVLVAWLIVFDDVRQQLQGKQVLVFTNHIDDVVDECLVPFEFSEQIIKLLAAEIVKIIEHLLELRLEQFYVLSFKEALNLQLEYVHEDQVHFLLIVELLMVFIQLK